MRNVVRGGPGRDERRQARELQTSEARLRAAIQASPVAILEVDLDDWVARWNPAAERMFAGLREEMVGGLLRHVPPERQEELRGPVCPGAQADLHGNREHAPAQGWDADRRRGLRRADPGRGGETSPSLRRLRGHHRRQAPGGGDPRLAGLDRRGRRRGATAPRAQPARRRAAAPGRALAGPPTRPVQGGDRSRGGCGRARVGARGARRGLDELRELARGIHPAVLLDRGLTAALEALVSRSPIPVEIDAPENEPRAWWRPPLTTSSPRPSPTWRRAGQARAA